MYIWGGIRKYLIQAAATRWPTSINRPDINNKSHDWLITLNRTGFPEPVLPLPEPRFRHINPEPAVAKLQTVESFNRQHCCLIGAVKRLKLVWGGHTRYPERPESISLEAESLDHIIGRSWRVLVSENFMGEGPASANNIDIDSNTAKDTAGD